MLNIASWKSTGQKFTHIRNEELGSFLKSWPVIEYREVSKMEGMNFFSKCKRKEKSEKNGDE